jgi:hypothetical protein
MVWRVLRLLDEGMQDHNSFANQKAVERPANAGFATRPKLEQTTAERT